MVTRKALYVEGGGDHKPALATELRKAFKKFLESAGTGGLCIHACGSRGKAFKAFKNAPATETAFLLVDSEDIVAEGTTNPWHHVTQRDGWDQPNSTADSQLHFMATCMETWLVADPEGLKKRLRKLNADALPLQPDLEPVGKDQIQRALSVAMKDTRMAKYAKKHGFELLQFVDGTVVQKRCRTWAPRFFKALRN